MEPSEANPSLQSSILARRDNGCPVGYYKPNIWSYDHLQTLAADYKNVGHSEQVEKLKEKLSRGLGQETEASTKLRVIDSICKMGMFSLFKNTIMEAFDGMAADLKTKGETLRSLGDVALGFRLLRQHGYAVSQGVFADFLDEKVPATMCEDIKDVLNMYEASYLDTGDESLLTKAGDTSHEQLKALQLGLDDQALVSRLVDALGLPQHWRAPWFGVRQQIEAYEMDIEGDSTLLELAKVNFRMVQATHQRELRDLSMWWKSLGLVEKISFARDRLVESFAFAVGIAPEPHYTCLRKCLTKVISFILVLDDIYDTYGTLDELEHFTNVVNRWEWEGNLQLPELMKTCFSKLSDTTTAIAQEIEKETGFPCSLPYLRKAWADFCKSMLVEARRYNRRYTPTLEEYLNTGWVSSSGSLLSMVILLHGREELNMGKFDADVEETQSLIHYTSLIIRLCNDVATTAAELERGDSPSSILCYMREAGVTEEVARLRIKDMISSTWKKINGELVKESPVQRNVIEQILNTGRVAHCFYHTGDGFGVQDGNIKRQIKLILIEPLALFSSIS